MSLDPHNLHVPYFEIVDHTLLSHDRYLANTDMGDRFFAEQQHNRLMLFKWPGRPLPLVKDIYFSPGASPLVTNTGGYAIGTQTCFQNTFAPSPSYIFDTLDSTISLLPQRYCYQDYRNLVIGEIDRVIETTYQNHEKVHLFFSGGSDSLVLLSAIMNKKLLDRTVIVTVENRAINHSNQLYCTDPRKQVLAQLLDWLKPRCLEVQQHVIDTSDLVNVINQGNLWQLKSYSSYTMFQRYTNSALMLGIKGNNTLLHRGIIAGQIMLNNPAQVWPDFTASSQFYTRDLLKYNPSIDTVPIEHRFFAKKSYPKLSGVNNNTLSSPLGTDSMFRLLRQLDWTTVDLSVVSDALLPRYIMNHNVGDQLDQYMTYENTTEWDNMDSQMIDITRLNSDAITVPMDLEHHPAGLDWIEYELEQAEITGWLSLNTIVSIKSLQMISNRFKNATL